jgi:iron complex outermembrane receptor protein
MVLDDFNQYKTAGGTANLAWSLSDGLTLHAISHYMHFDKRQALDTDASPTPQSLVLQTAKQKTFSQEIRLNGDTDRAHWVAGLYYLHIGVNYVQGLAYSPDSPISILFFNGKATESPIFVDMSTNSYSVFGQLEFNLTDTWSIIAGARGIKEKKDFNYSNYWYASVDDATIDSNQAPLPIPVDPAGNGARYPSYHGNSDDNLWTGKLQLDYKPTQDLLFYAGVNRGAKAGGFNAKLNDFSPAAAPSAIPYRPEVLYAEEGGAKWTFLGGTSRLNGSVYHYDYKGYQAFVFSNVSGLIQNADASYNGAELEFDTKPVQRLTLSAGVSYIDATVKDLPIAPGLIRDVRPTFTPKWEISGLARYELPGQIEGGNWAAQVTAHYQSDSYFNIRNFAADDMAGYTTFNAQLDWTSADTRWGVTLFVNNLTDKVYKVGGFDLATLCGCNEESYGKPRWFGVRIHAATN